MNKTSDLIRTYTMRIKVTRKQDVILSAMLEECRELYNASLGERISAWKTCRKSISLFDQFKELTQLRGSIAEEKSFPVMIQRDPLKRVDLAFPDTIRSRCQKKALRRTETI